MRIIVFTFLFFTFSFTKIGEDRKKIYAQKATEQISIDGIIDEGAWNLCPVATGFRQLDPNPGDDPMFPTEVKFMYDDEAIYIAAIMYDDEPSKILKQLYERDGRGNADRFFVAIDTYQDGLNGFQFEVSAAGVQSDAKLSFSGRDRNWDAVWESAVKITNEGWVAELRIPYLSLRFPNKDQQTWNIQYGREIRRTREESYWNEIDPAIDGFLNQSGQITGIQDIEPPTRFNFTPFVTGYLNTAYDPQSDNGMTAATAYTAGMDMKLGLNDAFTLDMTLIPDFGQTVFDNQVLNLSPFEVRFEENRQFFTEGTELFDKGGLFYSRRVGGRPLNYNSAGQNLSPGEYVSSNPNITRLYNASKVSGRTTGGLGVGVFNAIAAEEYATIKDAEGNSRRVKTNPLTNYSMVVFDQNLSNNSYITFLNTNVMRSGSDYDANVTGLTFQLNDKQQMYSVNAGINVSQRYFSSATDLGHRYNVFLEKISGKIQGFLGYIEESDSYNPNDLGFNFAPNERTWNAGVSYNQFEPVGNLLSYNFRLRTQYKRLYNPNVFTDYNIDFRTFVLTKSRFASGINLRLEPIETFDYFEPRTSDFSRAFLFPKNFRFNGWISSDYRKPIAFDASFSYRWYDHEFMQDMNFRVSPRFRVNDKLSMRVEAEARYSDAQTGYVSLGALIKLPEEVKEGDILFGQRDRVIFENALSGKYIFNENMALTLRVRHYWDNVQYQRFGTLHEDGRLDLIPFNGIVDGDRIYDRNFNIFNVDLNYQWRFAPGSDIIFNWQNQIASSSDDFDNNYFQNLGNLFEEIQQNNLSLKIVYWLDYNRLTS